MVNTSESAPLQDLRTRALRLTTVFTDCDGVLTDGGVYYDRQGEAMLRFDRRDGMGVERLRLQGLEVAIITREASPIVEHRAAKLKLRVFSGVRDKCAAFPSILKEMHTHPDACAYMGDDVNDLELLRHVFSSGGLTAAPSDAASEVRPIVHKITEATGGHGSFREFCEWILHLRGANI
jgi:3-deoxy-D-manno-octulosonate 8-phosphate phosphatase (KDO 8-P phosphatase)